MVDIPALLQKLTGGAPASGSITKAEFQAFIDAEISKGVNYGDSALNSIAAVNSCTVTVIPVS